MHELGIAQSIVEAIERELDGRPGARLKSVLLKIGEYSGVDTESLTFCFASIVKETELEEAELRVERTDDDALELSQMELEVP